MGSPDALTSGPGATFTQAFDAFGAPDPDNAELTRNGFTGHDHDRDLGLIDMKGRVYDPLAGRFLSADPVMQAPHWSQGMNRYAYVYNDPVNATDPSGFAAAGLDGYAVPAHLTGTVIAAYASSSASTAGLAAAGTMGAVSGGISLAWGVPGMFTSTPGFSGTVTDAASVAPTAGGATQPGMVDALGQNRGIQDALPRYRGGSPGRSGLGGSEGAGGGGGAPARTFDPGPLLRPAGDGTYALSDAARARFAPAYSKIGGIPDATIRFGSVTGGIADTDFVQGRAIITIDKSDWMAADERVRTRTLAHEFVHPHQYQKLGRWRLIGRNLAETVEYGPIEKYSVPDGLLDIPLERLNLVDPRFSLEAVAEHVADYVPVGPL